MTTNIYADLPTIVELYSIDDAGEGGAATCPHCGAVGRYVYWFLANDGETYGAMRGCFSKFPKSKYFERLAEILKKQIDATKKGRNIASWDSDVMEGIRNFAHKVINADELDEIIRRSDRAKKAWMVKRGYR